MAPAAYRTCDVCRKRKTKCIPPPDDNDTHDSGAPCTNCTRLGIRCTYDHVYRKPGRPSSFAKAYHEAEAQRASASLEPMNEPHGHAQPVSDARNAPRVGAGGDERHRDRASSASGSGVDGSPTHRRHGNQREHDPLSGLVQSFDTRNRASGSYSDIPRPSSLSLDQIQPQRDVSLSFPSAGLSMTVPIAPAPLPLSAPTPSSMPLLDAFAFVEPDMFADFDPDAGEHDQAIDWPTMSSGNGYGVGSIGVTGSASGVPGGSSGAGGYGSYPSSVPPATHPQSGGYGQGQSSTGVAGTVNGNGGGNNIVSVNGNANGNPPAPAPAPATAAPQITTHSSALGRERDFQIEEIAPWHIVSFFVSLYLGYSHSLFPMVHRPSFSQRLAMRDDRRDRDFRALVLGIVAYTIGQSPLSRMTGSFNRHELSSLQHRCHRGSMMLLDRSYKSPSVLHVATLSAGYFYCQSVGKTNRALTLVSEACQLMHLLRMHDDEATAAMGLDAVEVQVRRRIWWHVHAVDITEASAGHMIHLNSFEGQPSFPDQVDDEYITSQGAFPQPAGTTSYIVGLVACVRLFPILSEVITRSRSFRAKNRLGRFLSANEVTSELDWIQRANGEVDGIMAGLPDVLRMGWTVDETLDEVRLAVMGMQRANMAITAVSIRFALADYRAELEPDSTTLNADRAAMGKEAYHTLSNIPLDDLAANGESSRGKIFRILLALLKCVGDTGDWANTLQDWWTLFSRVQFVQLMTSNVESRLPSRANSPIPPVQVDSGLGGRLT